MTMVNISIRPERGAREGSLGVGTAYRLSPRNATQASHSIFIAAIASMTRWLNRW
jgi:hypothetical protein